jgi:photosystem II stability/assembly factor-like uncharacterized protein
MFSLRNILKFAVTILFLCVGVHAGDENSLFGTLIWRSIGPNRGGRSLASTGINDRPLEYYFGAVGGGLWKSTDGGLSWKPVTDGQIKSSFVGAIGVAESNPDIIYIGMGETELRGNIIQGDGIYKSIDAGNTWTHAGLEDSQAISRVRVDPRNADTVYVAALGHPFGPNEQRGVFRSRNGGKSWERILYRSDHAGAVDLCLDPHNPEVLYASLWDVYRTPWSLSSGGPDGGLFKSYDGGDTWTEVTRNPGLPKGIIGKIGVAVFSDSNDKRRIYAMVESEDGGVFRSDDDGGTWQRINDEHKLRQRAFYFSRIYADPVDRETVYVLNYRFWRSTDGGRTYKAIKELKGDNHDLWISRNDPRRMINSNDGGASVSTNGGETWTLENYPTAQMYHVATTSDHPYHVCGAQQDWSTECLPSDAGLKFRDPEMPPGNWLYSVGGGESGYIAPDPVRPNLFYAGDQGAVLTRYDQKIGEARDIQVYPLFFSGMSAASLKERWQWTFPIVFSPTNGSVMYTSSQHLWKTTNDGQSWERISADLTRADPKTLGDSGGPISKDQNGPEIYGTIFTIAPSHFDAGTIWTGSDDGLAYITRDGGATWTNITPADLPSFSRITMIDASHLKPGTAYLTAVRYQLDDQKPYVFRTDDYGKTWTKIVDGIRPGDFVRVVREDPVRDGLLYAGSEHGVYVSFNNGGRWQSLTLNLPDTQVPDLIVKEDDLIIATHGRSFYILDDVNVLRQLTPSVAQQDLHVFRPRSAICLVRGAVFNYFLQQAVPVTIEVLDAKGTVVRVFTSTLENSTPPKTDATQNDGGSEEDDLQRKDSPAPSTSPGVNRFLWDLHYAGAKTFSGMVLLGADAEVGPVALPGDYAVRVTANGRSETQPFRIEKGPLLTSVSQADLRKQFRLAMQVQDKFSQADEMVIAIRGINQQMRLRLGQSKDAMLIETARNLSEQFTEIEEALYQVQNRSSKDPIRYPIKLNNQLAALERVVETGHCRPTDSSYLVFQELSTQLSSLQKRLQRLLERDLVKLNYLLEQQGLAEVRFKFDE